MSSADTIMRLFSNVLHDDIRAFHLSDNILRSSVDGMRKVYSRTTNRLSSSVLDLADFDDAAYRCAYLHMYAPLHTCLMQDTLIKLFASRPKIFDEILWNSGHIRLCSIGGGPGTDVVGSLAALHKTFGYIQFTATIVDYMTNWRFSFYSVLEELRSGSYSTVGANADQHYFEWNYLCENLLNSPMSSELIEALTSADIVTMVKFLSAAACRDSEVMLQNIFRAMRPGAVILFIDNAAGGFPKLMLRCAESFGFKSLYGPVNHLRYSDTTFKVTRFGYTSCFELKVAIQVWQKPLHGTEPLPVLSKAMSLRSRTNMHAHRPSTSFNRSRISFAVSFESLRSESRNKNKRKKKSNRYDPSWYFSRRTSRRHSRKSSRDRRKSPLPDVIPRGPPRRVLLPLENSSSANTLRVVKDYHHPESSESSSGCKRSLDCFPRLKSKRPRR